MCHHRYLLLLLAPALDAKLLPSAPIALLETLSPSSELRVSAFGCHQIAYYTSTSYSLHKYGEAEARQQKRLTRQSFPTSSSSSSSSHSRSNLLPHPFFSLPPSICEYALHHHPIIDDTSQSSSASGQPSTRPSSRATTYTKRPPIHLISPSAVLII